MILWPLLLFPLITIFVISNYTYLEENNNNKIENFYKYTALGGAGLNLVWSILIWILFDFSINEFQFSKSGHIIQIYDITLGIDGISVYFILLTTLIIPVALLSNWNSINENIKSYLIIILLLEFLLITVFLVLDILLFYILFESILPPLFLLIGLFGSKNKVRASYYFFLYTLWGSLFLLLSILSMCTYAGTTDFNVLFSLDFNKVAEFFLFCGIFIAFAIKTPIIFFNNWLLKAHVESPLGGSIILAGIVLKLSLYGIFRLILPIISKAYIETCFIVYGIGVITIIYASFSTLRTTDIKELIAYSSVCHAAVYLIGAFSNTIQGIEGSIVLGLAHGFVSSGLFICAGGILYERFGTRLIYVYRGMTQLMPIFSILFFILSLGNCGAPLTLNFVGEFMSLYGIVEKFPVLGFFACSSIILSAAYTIYMFNRTSFGGFFTKVLENNVYDVNKKEFFLLIILVLLTVILGIYPMLILDTLECSVINLLFRI
jgi:NADH-ubiquinone oxidoreductase chain 4